MRRLVGDSGGWFVDVITAAAHEHLAAWLPRGSRRLRDAVGRGIGRRQDGIANADTAAFPCDQIDSEFLVAEGRPQRAGDVEVAAAGFGIDIGGAATAVAAVDTEQRIADSDVAADPVELLPGVCAVTISSTLARAASSSRSATMSWRPRRFALRRSARRATSFVPGPTKAFSKAPVL